MLYVSQLDHKDIPYPTNVKEPESDLAVNGNIADAGCGLASVCMMLDRLCFSGLSLIEVRDLAVKCKANMDPGTDMTILAPEVADLFDLDLETTNDSGRMKKCLERGGCVIANPGGDYEGHYGLFTHGGHYIVIVSYFDGEFLVLDPSWRETKFKEEKRKGRVREAGKLVYVNRKELDDDTYNRDPRYFLFTRKSDIPSKEK
jgi:hypothetical protein